MWIGLITLIAAFYIWKDHKNDIVLAALLGGLAHLGYFLFMDLGGHAQFMPGTVMTLVSVTAIITNFIGLNKSKNRSETEN